MTSSINPSQPNKESRLAVIGKTLPTVCFDFDKQRVTEINRSVDSNNELAAEQFNQRLKIEYSFDANYLNHCDIYMITPAKPVHKHNQPDHEPVSQATQLVASYSSQRSFPTRPNTPMRSTEAVATYPI